ncbi:hypothetical protein F383_36017 [Gossypium arboreum]|uniref:Uncharacterized protein n=1 Tax=Gossypium arboreum TaxID=29729 RepID=A0A0B0N394_GOSAR|nr:hypothetical protein F383_36017 [Gossypium arboreum]
MSDSAITFGSGLGCYI